MLRRPRAAAAAAALLTAFALGASQVLTAANTVPSTRAGRTIQAITPDTLKPAQCAAITLTNLYLVTGNGGGGPGNDLILGANDSGKVITGGSGDDCMVAGGFTNQLRGEGGYDICIGPASTNFHGTCEEQIVR